MKKIAVFGASGFVGATFVERMLASGDHQIKPVIHSAGNAWRLTRRATLELQTADVFSKTELASVLEGCTHVVNCSRGNAEVMIKGLDNLLQASRTAGVERFVHLSSVAVYGEPPHPQSSAEDAPAQPEKGSYGWTKLRQDQMVERAASAGLPSVILCPPNISGAHSPYLIGLVNTIRTGGMALVEDGGLPANFVDVENLAHAIERALFCPSAKARRLFITDDGETTWRDVAQALAPLAGHAGDWPTLTRDEAERASRPAPAPSGSVAKSLKHLVSSEVNEALRRDPYFEKIDGILRLPVKALGTSGKQQVKRWVTGPRRVPKVGEPFPFDPTLCRTQCRGVRHSNARAKQEIGYAPPLSAAESMSLFARWYRTAYGVGAPEWELAEALFHA